MDECVRKQEIQLVLAWHTKIFIQINIFLKNNYDAIVTIIFL